MIGGKDQKGLPRAEEVNAFLGKGTTFEGKMTFQGMFRLDGRFTGEIFAGGFLIIGEAGEVNARINVDALIVNGKVSGSVAASTRVEIHPPGRVTGDMKTPVLVIAEGAIFEGNCQMEKRETKRDEKVTLLEVTGDPEEEGEAREIEKDPRS
jgi:cytoskeletal protein CcmA (bactofilin family)